MLKALGMRSVVATLLLTLSVFSFAQEKDSYVKVLLETTAGDIVLELNRDRAPISVENFLTYVNSKHYDGTIFHRVIKDFMIQGGGMDENMRMKPMLQPIKNEAKNGLKNVRGSIAMARTGVVDSATSQFFINVKNNTLLDHGTRDYGYAVFGEVIQGMDIVDNIGKTKTTSGDVPVTPIIIKSASVLDVQAD